MDECFRLFSTRDFPRVSNIVKKGNTARFGNVRTHGKLTSSQATGSLITSTWPGNLESIFSNFIELLSCADQRNFDPVCHKLSTNVNRKYTV